MSDLKEISSGTSLLPPQILFCVLFEKYFCLVQSHGGIILCFLLRALFFFTFMSIIQLELIFEYVISRCQASCFHMDIQLTLFMEKSTLSPGTVAVPLS